MTEAINKSSPTLKILSLARLQSNEGVLGDNGTYIEAHAEDIDKVHSLMCDEQSRKNYMQEIGLLSLIDCDKVQAENFNCFTRSNWERVIIPAGNQFLAMPNCPKLQASDPRDGLSLNNCIVENFLLNQYRYQDLVKVEPQEIFIDCGAFLGDTALWAYMNGAAQVYSFEPGKIARADLEANLKRYNFPVENVVPFAVSDVNSQQKFFSGGSANSCAHFISQSVLDTSPQFNTATSDVECVRLDDWCTEHQVVPTFIKMDVEGAEGEALAGASEIIKRYKPKLAICLYHKLEHMWELPLFIHSLVPEYKFYCKKSHPIWEFVLFATL